MSLYLTLRISYRKVFAAVHARLPSVHQVKDTMTSFRSEIASEKPSKSSLALETRKKDLEKELEAARREREMEKQKVEGKQVDVATQHVPIQKKDSGILENLFGTTTAVPLIKSKGDNTATKEPSKSVKTPDF